VRPNPFSLGTQIEYMLPQAGHVQLRIYDPAGRKVRTLVDQWAEPHQQAAAWDGRDATGAPVPAGAYFLRLEANGEVRTAKLTLTR
ncbi:MAG TPA: FlgD immunoglobulin-like domain containing protein, partial [Candidatus Udaeobacter sp.]|nr:FlgD immunoglobulin-like domain containing protein [Candidatus Udaeobacter sp.]